MNRGKVIAATVAAAVVLLLLMWGSGAGTSVLHSPSGVARAGQGDQERTIQVDDQVVVTEVPNEEREAAAPALDWLMIAFALVILAIIVKLLQWLLNRDWEQSGPLDGDDEIDDLGLLLSATAQTVRAAALTEGEPRNVVVRCWVALEDAAASSGLERNPAETAAEFTARFLGTWDVDETTTRELAELYREARFSRHPVQRPAAERAVELVGSIHDQLRRANRAAAEESMADEVAKH